MLHTFKDVIDANARTYPDKTAFIFENKKYTYSHVNQRINRLINALKKLGIKKGAMWNPAYNCPQYFEYSAQLKPVW